jgi:hypothetical protein
MEILSRILWFKTLRNGNCFLELHLTEYVLLFSRLAIYPQVTKLVLAIHMSKLLVSLMAKRDSQNYVIMKERPNTLTRHAIPCGTRLWNSQLKNMRN